jgi:translation initiation factor IF-3
LKVTLTTHTETTEDSVKWQCKLSRLITTPPILEINQTPVIDKRRQRDLPQINERIRFPKIRVIDTDGDQLGILTPQEALRLAEEKELDLVLVSDKADPPVCRIMDYGKFKFEQEKKAREARKKQHTADVKEVKMRYKIEDHDYQVRVNQAVRFLKDGDKVKATITFRGREIQHSDLAEDLLKRMATDLEELAEVQQAPKREGRNMMMLLSPKK